ncbi:hypothetical protein PR048_008785 [Dryococelus australis]|uniref:Uncharacterized protein n=1 Tax=Dryococelus australis TaxID=614101 RepID=A0ABQ9HY29_9NEOP|nr:hypothetical protein PR048_008785 [Dryococelus australis]
MIDKLNQSMTNRFAYHKNLYLDLSYFDPKRFSELKVTDMESDSESETLEKIVQKEVRTCRMENPCKGCINCAYKLKLTKTSLRSNITNGNLEAFLIMEHERNKLVALENDMVIEKLCEQSEEMRCLLVL